MEQAGGFHLPWVLLGSDGSAARFAVDVSLLEEEQLEDLAGDGVFQDLRRAALVMSAAESGMLAHGRSLLDWHRRHGFCARCGNRTAMKRGGAVRQCVDTGCGVHHFPRVDPVAIMLVVRADRCLVGRQRQFPPGMYSALAGFIEPGESIEEAVRREVMEEVGVRVGSVIYVESQPWPFPSSLMIGCLAEALSEDIAIDPAELEAARWITRDQAAAALADNPQGAVDGPNRTDLPGRSDFHVPPPFAIAHHLIRKWVTGEVALKRSRIRCLFPLHR
ncbi:MAG: NAD(+) diphosphatase [Alphaproteobacteria bacterium]|nr:MAG: NAD(+) diphosphatase [Alphaproteobacteria bacterium]